MSRRNRYIEGLLDARVSATIDCGTVLALCVAAPLDYLDASANRAVVRVVLRGTCRFSVITTVGRKRHPWSGGGGARELERRNDHRGSVPICGLSRGTDTFNKRRSHHV